jgi:hypothetical protein
VWEEGIITLDVLRLEHQHIISISNMQENKENVRKVMDQIKLVEDIKYLQNNGFQIILCSDWKIIATIMSANQPTDDEFCIWCNANKATKGNEEFIETTREVPIRKNCVCVCDREKGGRVSRDKNFKKKIREEISNEQKI